MRSSIISGQTSAEHKRAYLTSVMEWLDLKPYLAPTKEECAMGKKASAEHARKSEPCMYRLYAVVVHIGSMVSSELMMLRLRLC